MAEPHRPFVIPLRRRWVLAILPIICLVYFVAILILAIQGLKVAGVTTDQLVLGGAALFVVTFLVEIPFFFRRKAPRDDGPDAPYEPMDLQDEPPEMPVRADDETVLTTESQQGMRVLEYSAPAKSRHKGAVYAKTYVPVTKEHVLRVETLAAEGRDL